MKQVVIENPIINSAFCEPTRHFRFDDEGITNEIVEARRTSHYFIPIAKPKKKGKQAQQLELDLGEWTSDRIDTGEIRNSSPDEIACWFIDTNYNGESFFVRHAYFTGADQPYDKLKRVLKAEIDESAWSALYSATSRPFDPPQGKDGKSGKIAIKVINHYGDEVLKVYEVV